MLSDIERDVSSVINGWEGLLTARAGFWGTGVLEWTESRTLYSAQTGERNQKRRRICDRREQEIMSEKGFLDQPEKPGEK